MTGTQRPNNILGEIALRGKLVESRNHEFDCPPPRLLLLDWMGMALPTPGVREVAVNSPAGRTRRTGPMKVDCNLRGAEDS